MIFSPKQLQHQINTLVQQPSPFPWLKSPDNLAQWSANLQLPTRKTENWKYTPLTALYQQDFFSGTVQQPSKLNQNQLASISELYSPIQNGQRLVFINGSFQKDLSQYSDLQEKGMITLFSQASQQQQTIIKQHYFQSGQLESELFSKINSHAAQEGVLIHAASDCVIESPIHILYVTTKNDMPCHSQSRLLVVAESHSKLQLIEQFDSETGTLNTVHNHVTQVFLKPNAHLTHLRLQVEDEQQIHINGLHVRLARDSQYEQHAMAFGSQLKRNDIRIHFDGSNAYCRLNGVFLSKHQQHIDNHLILEHAVPHCNSDTVYKGFITDKSRAVFDGRIHIHKQAQKTEANLNNKNLLLSKQAELNTKPELEIYADDVKCSHGASIGQLDEKSLFYFQSRGIDKASAEAILCLGFVNEMIELFPNDEVKALATLKLAAFFNDVDNLKDLWSMGELDEQHD